MSEQARKRGRRPLSRWMPGLLALALMALFNLGVVGPVMALECVSLEAAPSHAASHAHSHSDGHSHGSGHSHAEGGHAHASGHSHEAGHSHAAPSSPQPATPGSDECCADNIPQQQVALPASHTVSHPSGDLIALPVFAVAAPLVRLDPTPGACYGRDGPPGPRLHSQFSPSSLQGRAPPISA